MGGFTTQPSPNLLMKYFAKKCTSLYIYIYIHCLYTYIYYFLWYKPVVLLVWYVDPCTACPFYQFQLFKSQSCGWKLMTSPFCLIVWRNMFPWQIGGRPVISWRVYVISCNECFTYPIEAEIKGQTDFVLRGLSLLRPLTLKSHPDPYCLCQERRLFGPLGVEPQVEFEGPMFFFLYKSHWICGKGCFSGHHQSTYLWFGSTQDSDRNLWNNMQWIICGKATGMRSHNESSKSACQFLRLNGSKSIEIISASLFEGSTNWISKKVMAWTRFIDFYGCLVHVGTSFETLQTCSWFPNRDSQYKKKFVFPDCVPITWAWSKPWLSYRGVTIQVY